jgi:hypothetical protein
MSAALQLPLIWATADVQSEAGELNRQGTSKRIARKDAELEQDESVPEISLAFYRRHTEKVLQRYMYASMLVGRAPAMLGEPIARGWASCRKVKTFEDAVIFVLDVERCLNRLGKFDRDVLGRIALQEYTQAEAADLLGYSVRAISYKYPMALDRLTELLLKTGLLILPKD